MDFTRFGGDLLSHALRRSTIGATVLNFRVRDGTGCFTCAMTTKPRKIHIHDLYERSQRYNRDEVQVCFAFGSLCH